MARCAVRIGNGAIDEFLYVVRTQHSLVYYNLPIFSNFSFLKSTASSGLGTPDDTAHSGTNDLV